MDLRWNIGNAIEKKCCREEKIVQMVKAVEYHVASRVALYNTVCCAWNNKIFVVWYFVVVFPNNFEYYLMEVPLTDFINVLYVRQFCNFLYTILHGSNIFHDFSWILIGFSKNTAKKSLIFSSQMQSKIYYMVSFSVDQIVI